MIIDEPVYHHPEPEIKAEEVEDWIWMIDEKKKKKVKVLEVLLPEEYTDKI